MKKKLIRMNIVNVNLSGPQLSIDFVTTEIISFVAENLSSIKYVAGRN